jgi:hypothetical protein
MSAGISTRLGSLLLCSLLGAGMAGPALAQSTGYADGLLNNSWVFDLGAFVYTTSLKANLNGESSQNPEIDFDETFGEASDASRFRADALWRITPAHHLRLMYFDNSSTRSRVLDDDVHWGDYTFLAGSQAELRQEYKVLSASYEYAFMRRPTYELAANLGVHFSETNLRISGTADFTGPDCISPPCTASAASKSSSLPAPLPVIGLRAGWVVAPNWYVDAQGQFFRVKIDEYDGSWSDIRVSATWMFHRNFGLGLGYNRFYSNLDVTRNDFNGRVKLGYSGAQAFLTGTF